MWATDNATQVTINDSDPKPPSGSEVAALRISNAELAGRLAAVDDLSAHVDDLDARLIPAPTETPPPPPAVGDGDVAAPATADQDELQRRVTALSESMAAMDDRISNISTELANQLTELGAELDAASRRAEAGGTVDEDALVAHVERAVEQAMDEIQGGQERLAAEQARYQIQFRQDLADLAERLRRTNPAQS